jgi:SAM-dependent methyltransferase
MPPLLRDGNPLSALQRHMSGAVNLRAEAQRREYAAIVKRIAADRPGRLLDWGCGYGLISRELMSHGIDVASTDYDPAQPGRRASEHFSEVEIEFLADPVVLPFPDESFDAVLSLGVLEHVAQPAASLDEIRRVLRPAGTLYVYKLPNRHSWLEWVARRVGLVYHGSRPDDTLYTLRSAIALVEAHGFQVAEARRANMLPLTLNGRVANLLAGPISALNELLSRVPLLNLLATNVELVATRGVVVRRERRFARGAQPVSARS